MTDQSDFLAYVNPQDSKSKELYQEFYRRFLRDLTPQEDPCAIVFAGAPGSGKTTWRKANDNQVENVHLHDMDEILIHLSGYQNDLKLKGSKKAFEKWWPIARKIADQLVQYAIKSKYPILYDRTCGAEGSYCDLLKAKELGYRIIFNGFCIDPNIAFGRILKREEEEERTVTKERFHEYRARFSALWPYYLLFVDEAFLYDTSGYVPRLIFSHEEGIKDSNRYQAFLEEGSGCTIDI